MEVVQRFVDFFDGAKGPLHLALGPRRHAGPILAGGYVGLPGNAQRLHHGVKHTALGHRVV